MLISGELYVLLADLGTSQLHLNRISPPWESFASIQLMTQAASENTDANQLMTQAEIIRFETSHESTKLYPALAAESI